MEIINGELLRNTMKFRGYSLRSLAHKVSVKPIQVSHSMIGHLITGERKSCKPEVAKAIAKALDVPVESLFVAKVSMVSREVRKVAA